MGGICSGSRELWIFVFPPSFSLLLPRNSSTSPARVARLLIFCRSAPPLIVLRYTRSSLGASPPDRFFLLSFFAKRAENSVRYEEVFLDQNNTTTDFLFLSLSLVFLAALGLSLALFFRFLLHFLSLWGPGGGVGGGGGVTVPGVAS